MRELEARYREQVVVVGVHSAKFPAERESRHLRAAVQRFEVDHPIVNDGAFDVWQSYAVRAWPTLTFVDPEGKVIARHEGEFTVEMLAPVLDAMIAEFEAAGLLTGAATLPLVSEDAPAGLLAFPGGIIADDARDRLYIADTNHHQVLVTTLDGVIAGELGSGKPGLQDGPADSACFRFPQGLALSGGTLYVSDTENHAIRAIDLSNGRVTTVAGTGEQARSYVSGGPARETPLNSPWGIVVVVDVLYIAMAGNHQIWMHGIGSGEVRRYAGSGHEGLRDGRVGSAWLAQPSGIDVYDGELLFTDSETSSVRVAGLPGSGAGELRTLVGKDLFEFGDIDGDSEVARLQHPLGVAWHAASGIIYVADTYNNKIKRLDPETGVIESWLGDGVAGLQDDTGSAARFFEPSGVSATSDALYVADTNNHAIRRADIATGVVTTVIQ